MNILTAKNKILNFLYDNHDSICYNDFNKFFDTSTDRNEGITACFGGCQELINAGILSLNPLADTKSPETLRWVLTKSLFLHNHQLTVSNVTGLQLADVLSAFSSGDEEDSIDCDPTNLNEDNILELISVVRFLSAELAEKEEMEEMQQISNPPDSPNKKKSK